MVGLNQQMGRWQMRLGKPARNALLLLSAVLLAAFASAQQEARISDLSQLDREYMAQQREILNNLASSNLGRRFSGNTQNDLEILQLLLDRRLVRADQTRELQAMGVIMGDLLAADLDMHWVIYQDAVGRSRALRYRQSQEYLFPITMISRRQEADNHTPVAIIYQKAYDIIDPLRPELPFR
jgi:Domain of unknown function (DUF3806)